MEGRRRGRGRRVAGWSGADTEEMTDVTSIRIVRPSHSFSDVTRRATIHKQITKQFQTPTSATLPPSPNTHTLTPQDAPRRPPIVDQSSLNDRSLMSNISNSPPPPMPILAHKSILRSNRKIQTARNNPIQSPQFPSPPPPSLHNNFSSSSNWQSQQDRDGTKTEWISTPLRKDPDP